ncbi:MAG: hypothetical protein U0V70_03240 [Terriglobia bacterium]
MGSAVNKRATTDLAQQATVTPRLAENTFQKRYLRPLRLTATGERKIRWKFADNLTT